jgi:integrase
MPRLHLTDVVVSRLSQLGTYIDITTPAFGLRVGKNRKAWFVIRGRERLRTSIGLYPEISLADARKEAKKLLLQTPTKAERITLGEAYETFKAEHCATKKPRTIHDYTRILDKYYVPKLGKKRLSEITYEMITDITKHLADTPSEQAHALGVGRTFFRWCVRPPRRYIPYTPLEGVHVSTGKKRRRTLNIQELKTVWAAAGKQGYPHGTVVRLLILTGQRRGEIGALRWPWIDQKARTITLPDTITKNRKEHTFPYGEMAARIIAEVPRRNTTDLLFPSKTSDERPISGWSKFKHAMKDDVPKWRLHDLRRTFRTFHGQIGTPAEIGERLINHASAVTTEVEQIYDLYHYLPEMSRAMAGYEKFLRPHLARY